MNLVDSSGWLEFFANGPNASFFEPALAAKDDLIIPTLAIFEVFKVASIFLSQAGGLMKKLFALLFVLLLATTASAQNWFKGTLDQAVAKAKAENKLVLVDFFSGG